jgi:DNA repair protein RAD57
VLPSSPSTFPSSPYPVEEDPQQQPFDGSYLVGNPVRNEILSLLHQQRFFTGWGDSSPSFSYPTIQRPAQKTPALGLVWATQIACRIALKKEHQTIIDPLLPDSTPASSTSKPQPEPEMPGSPDKEDKAEPGPSRTETAPKEAETGTEPVSGSDTILTPVLPNKPSSSPSPPKISEPPVRRTMKLVFAPWAAGSVNGQTQSKTQDEVEFTIWKGGLKSCD